jgi:hypothetical protein
METTRVVPRGSKNTSVLGKIYSECKIFSSIIFILDKLESDGYFERINECLQFIFNKEMAFAVFELKKIKSRKKKFDIKNQLVNNTFIFKENLKIITGSLIDTLWNEKVRTEKIQQTIQKAQQEINKGTFEEIIELGEEEENYLSSDVVSRKETLELEILKNKANQEDFPHSYETDLGSKDFKFGSGEAKQTKGPSEDETYEIEQKIRKDSKEEMVMVEEESPKKEARDFGTFGEKIKKSGKGKNEWNKDIKINIENDDVEKESMEQVINKMNSKEILACQSTGNKWQINVWNNQSNGEKPRTSASMGNLTLKSAENGDSNSKKNISQSPEIKQEKSKWKRSSGMNMYLLSRKNGSSKGSSMRSVSKSGSLRLDNSNGAKSESLKRKRENAKFLEEEIRKKPIPKRTLADRLSGQKYRKINGALLNKKKQRYPNSNRMKINSSMTPDINIQRRDQRVSSLTKIKRRKNHLKMNQKNPNNESFNEGTFTKRGRKLKNRSPHQILKNLISDFDKPPKIKKKQSSKVNSFHDLVGK